MRLQGCLACPTLGMGTGTGTGRVWQSGFGPLVCITVDGVTRSCTFWLQGPRWHGWAGAASLKRGSGDRVAGAKDNPTEVLAVGCPWLVADSAMLLRRIGGCRGTGWAVKRRQVDEAEWRRAWPARLFESQAATCGHGRGHNVHPRLGRTPLTCRSFLSQPELARQSVSQ
jgi:hypothetical protein